MFISALLFFLFTSGAILIVFGGIYGLVEDSDGIYGVILGVLLVLAGCGIHDMRDSYHEKVQETQVVQKVQQEKPLGVQGEYRVVFNEDLDSEAPRPHWEFQKWHKKHWVGIITSDNKAQLVKYAQSYVKDVQSKSKVITITKEMKPVLSDSSVESASAIEVQ